ncbi:hypothetical protein C2L92_04900 [Coxiella burnetii]|nr:hypothetical protein C2L92_04900 [Coxiella burnetii]PNT81474.1 hypothetical protein C2L91_05015 [Coxiella burnetii]PNT84189.1 hypothetical protein C2L90_04975 [Coxiella burnetii]PNT88182.1 hypothetical protein C2L94_04040 [Coxiella burnetii]PNT89495.1 hypothetical protein C2L89_03980 [Coxiella burnetii]
MKRDVIKSVGFQQVARMSEAKYGKTTMSSIVPVFRFAHTGYLVFFSFSPRLDSKDALSCCNNHCLTAKSFPFVALL